MATKKGKVFPLILGAFIVVLLGVFSAWLISSRTGSPSKKGAPGVNVTSKEAGKLDVNVEYDNATGMLEKGGINGEGNYHLVRDGGASRYIALTSSMVDLGNFAGKNVNIWGQTLSSSRPGGWLMDVAKIQVSE